MALSERHRRFRHALAVLANRHGGQGMHKPKPNDYDDIRDYDADLTRWYLHLASDVLIRERREAYRATRVYAELERMAA